MKQGTFPHVTQAHVNHRTTPPVEQGGLGNAAFSITMRTKCPSKSLRAHGLVLLNGAQLLSHLMLSSDTYILHQRSTCTDIRQQNFSDAFNS